MKDEDSNDANPGRADDTTITAEKCVDRPALVEDNAHLISRIELRTYVEASPAIMAVVAYFGDMWPDGDNAISRADIGGLLEFVNYLPPVDDFLFPDSWTNALRARFNQLHLIRGSALNDAVGQERNGNGFISSSLGPVFGA
jgi:hypothetical protein